MSKGMWVYNPKAVKSNISVSVKAEMKKKCDIFIQGKLKQKHVRPFDKTNKKEMQLVDICSKLIGNKILFIGVYKDLRQGVLLEDYEIKFARIWALNGGTFSLDFMRHNGEWVDISFMSGGSLEECFEGIEELPYFAL